MASVLTLIDRLKVVRLQVLHPFFSSDVDDDVRDNALGAVSRMLASTNTDSFPLEQVLNFCG